MTYATRPTFAELHPTGGHVYRSLRDVVTGETHAYCEAVGCDRTQRISVLFDGVKTADELASFVRGEQYGPAVVLAAYDEDEARDAAGSELFDLTEPTPPSLSNLRRVADLARSAREESLHTAPQSQTDLAVSGKVAYRMYVAGVEDVLRWLAGDAAPTPELSEILDR